ncbi:MAG: hypothetical protein H6581_19475 [Bacteroidia bacterium]|nr:hypothetical protein [Bacteroidia bacterium]
MRLFSISFLLFCVVFLYSCEPSNQEFVQLSKETCDCFQGVMSAPSYPDATVKLKTCNETHSLQKFNLKINEFLIKHAGYDRAKLAGFQGEVMACKKAAEDYIESENQKRTDEHTAWEADRNYVRDGSSIVGKWTIDYIGASVIAENAKESGFTYTEDGKFVQRLGPVTREGTYVMSPDGKQLTMTTTKGAVKTLDVFEISEKYFTYAEAGMNTGKVRMRRE